MRGLYAIIDPSVGSDPLEVAAAAVRGGCAALQLRAKRLPDAQFLALGHELARVCRTTGVPFFVNDRFELARELAADGVHVGQTDASIETVRERIGKKLSIGVSTHSLAQALDAERRGASMIGFGPIFATSSKADPDPIVGLDGLREVCARVNIPVIAIGGIGEHNVDEIAATGAPLAAVISALACSPDPEQTARTLHRSFMRI